MQEKLEKLEDALFVEQEGLDALVSMLSTNLISLANLAGTFAMAAVPALFTGFSVYTLTLPIWTKSMALGAGWTTAIGIEAVGMVASYTALRLYRSWRNGKSALLEFYLALALMLVYIVTVGGIVAFVDSLGGTLKAVGVGSPILATVLYVARGLYLDVRQRETQDRLTVKAQQERDEEVARREADLEAELKRLKAKQSYDLKLRELELRYGLEEGRKFPVNLPEGGRETESLPVWLTEAPANLRQFKYMVDEGIIILPPGVTGDDLAKHIPAVGTDRTGRNWLRAIGYREMNGNGVH